MTIEIIKGLKFFYVLLLVLYVSFAVAFTNLFRVPGVRFILCLRVCSCILSSVSSRPEPPN